MQGSCFCFGGFGSLASILGKHKALPETGKGFYAVEECKRDVVFVYLPNLAAFRGEHKALPEMGKGSYVVEESKLL